MFEVWESAHKFIGVIGPDGIHSRTQSAGSTLSDCACGMFEETPCALGFEG